MAIRTRNAAGGYEMTYQGYVLEIFEKSVMWSMDPAWETQVFARVWDADALCEREIYLYTPPSTDRSVLCEVDADEHIRAIAAAWDKIETEKRRLARLAKEQEEAAYEEARQSIDLSQGAMVVIYKGTKHAHGTVGEVVWFGEKHVNAGGFGKLIRRVAIATTTRKDYRGRFVDVIWTDDRNVRVLPPSAASLIRLGEFEPTVCPWAADVASFLSGGNDRGATYDACQIVATWDAVAASSETREQLELLRQENAARAAAGRPGTKKGPMKAGDLVKAKWSLVQQAVAS